MSWFHFVGGAMVKYGLKALAGAVPFGEVLVDVAADIWGKYRKGNLAADLQAAAAAPPAEVQKAIAQAVQEVAADQPPEVRAKLSEYLAQAPYAIRRSLRRPSDVSGTTVPASLSIQQARDLVPFLPTALPRFKAGDRPLPGAPLVLRELLGKGGFGEVWLASHPRDDTLQVALKFCLDERAAQSLRHESRVLKQVRSQGKHAGIVQLRQIWDECEPLCLEYEYVEGGDLSGLIREMHAGGPPSPDVVARWMLNLLEPIRFVHALNPPIVHRDLKPSNILVERQKDGNYHLRIADFGISDIAAKQALRDTAGNSILTIGFGGFTALYASPQQMNNKPADPRDDVHALGVIWLQMLTGDLNKGRPAGRGWKVPLRSRGMTEPILELLELCVDDVDSVRPDDAGDLFRKLASLVRTKREEKGARDHNEEDPGLDAVKAGEPNSTRLHETGVLNTSQGFVEEQRPLEAYAEAKQENDSRRAKPGEPIIVREWEGQEIFWCVLVALGILVFVVFFLFASESDRQGLLGILVFVVFPLLSFFVKLGKSKGGR